MNNTPTANLFQNKNRSRPRHVVMLVVGALVAIAICQTGESDFRALLESLRTARSVSGRVEIVIEAQHGKSDNTEIFAFQKPNFSRMESWTGHNLYTLSVSDGKKYWTLDAVQNRLGRIDAPPDSFFEDEFLLSPFLRSDRSRDLLPTGEPAKLVRYRGRNAFDLPVGYGGKPKKGVQAHVFLDSKGGALLGLTYASRDSHTEVVFKELQVGRPIAPALFTYQPKISPSAMNEETMLVPINAMAPNFSGFMVGGKRFDFGSTLKNSKAVILDFWGVGCDPCKKQLPELQELQRKYASRGLSVVTVDLFDDENTLSEFAKKTGLNLPIVFARSCSPDVVYGYKATVEPTTYLIDSNGRIAGHYSRDDLTPLKTDLAKLGFP